MARGAVCDADDRLEMTLASGSSSPTSGSTMSGVGGSFKTSWNDASHTLVSLNGSDIRMKAITHSFLQIKLVDSLWYNDIEPITLLSLRLSSL
jgi:hypothetical protein